MRLYGRAALDYAAQAGLPLQGPRGPLDVVGAEELLTGTPDLVSVDTLPDEEAAPPVPRDSPLARLLGVRTTRSN